MNFAALPLPIVGEEKTIPFLRNLTEMLEKNSRLISFIPGDKFSSQITPGKIVIHDRKLVEDEVLPIYFNHKSFASLRRQLSYFSFVRVGKSSRGKVIYANDAVFEIADILKLKRRSTSSEKKAQDQHHQQKEHYHQDKKNQHLMATSSDVVSAVNSGMLNAAKANDKLESMKNCPPPAVTSSYCRTSSTTHSSLSASSDNEGATKKVSNSYNNNKKKRSSSLQKYKLRRKDRARLKKMLRYNRIVPFIHLPSTPNLVEVDTNASSSRGGGAGTKRDSGTGLGDAEVKCNKKKRSNTNEAAINALLSLGAP